MGLFRKHKTPEELGATLYEALRTGMASGARLSVAVFLEGLGRTSTDFDEQYLGEIMTALMFGGLMAIERSAPSRVAEQITAGMKAEFFQHLAEQGASAVQKAEWENVVADRFLNYRKCLEDYEGFEPPWKLGREFYWILVGQEDHNAMAIKATTMYLLDARDVCQDLLNEFGPTLIIEKQNR